MEPTQIRLTIPDSVDPLYLTGPADSLLREIESSCAALISIRGKAIFLSGTSQEIEQLTLIFSRLIQMVESGSRPTLEDVKLLLDSTKRNASLEQTGTRTLFVTHKGKAIQPKTQGQIEYTKAIANNSITFGIGPAGTGKTYLAVAMALAALTSQQISRIVLVRPVVEAGESLGFLPGTLQEKLDPYIRPLYDALFDMTSMEYANNLIEQGIVEIAPLAFMRGRTMNDAFVILDEAQNTTPEQMKMFLTRLGFSSKFVITGDATQRDLVGRSGLDVARQVLGNLEDVAFVDLDRNDIVRHTLVGKIVDAYTAHEKKQLGE
ncbi:MAG: PhoH family protein [Atopobium sp.]|nr:PhoH family protein [Atopobium sp.]